MDRPMDRERAPEPPREERADPAAGAPVDEGGDAGPAGEPEPLLDPEALVQPYIDRLQRLQADFDNFRRRSQQELREREDRVVAQVFRHLLPVVDDLRLAARADERSEEGISAGLRIILDKVAALLDEFAIEEIPAIGSPFDPRWHEALAHQPTEAAPPGVVLDEFERGYRLRDLLVRPARVIVAKSPGPPAAGGE